MRATLQHKAQLYRQLATLKSRLVYPAMLMVAATLLQPLPALAAGMLTVAAYGFGVMLKVSAFYTLW
jgi:hypothetical protein